MTRRDPDDVAGGIANLEVLDEQRLAHELRWQQHRSVAFGAQAPGFAVGRRNSVERQANQELLGSAAVRDDGSLRRQPGVLEPRRVVGAGKRADEADRQRQQKDYLHARSEWPKVPVSALTAGAAVNGITKNYPRRSTSGVPKV